jgi:putative hydrolase of the HAD superfamily
LFTHFSRPEAWRIDPDAALVLSALAARGFTLGIASNFDHRLRSVTAGFPEMAFLSSIVISAEIGWRKPAREFFAALCQRVELQAEQVLLVGDDVVNDYEGARSCGLHAVLVNPGSSIAPPAHIRRLLELLA